MEAMMKQKFFTVLIIASFLIQGCAQLDPNQTPTSEPRTYYESLDLETPTDAVKTFISAYKKNDFFTVFLILSPESQSRWTANLRLFNYKGLTAIKDPNEFHEIFDTAIKDYEHHMDAYYFDMIMMAADNHQVLLFDFPGTTKILDEKEIELEGTKYVDIAVKVEEEIETMTFRMVQSPSQRWRVYQVILPGGDEDLVPWAIPEDAKK